MEDGAGGRQSLRARFVLAALIASIPLVLLVTYSAVDRYDSDRNRAETRAATRAQLFATLLADRGAWPPTAAQLRRIVGLLPHVSGSATIVYGPPGMRTLVRVGDPDALPGPAATVRDALAGGRTTFGSSERDGTLRVWGLSRVEGTPTLVAYGSPGADVYGAARSALWRDFALALAAVLAALAAAFLLARRVTRPVTRRSEQLVGANEALQAANEAKNEFLSRMSHELRTPLTAIMGFNELLALSDLDDERKRWASMSLRSSRHLLDLVNEVLDLSRIEAGELSISPETIPLQPVLQEAMEMMQPLASTRRVTVHPPTLAPGAGYVLADNQRLKQVLINVISNAIKYNREGGDVLIDVSTDRDERIRLAVTDNGPGLDPASIEKLFAPFERLDAAARGVDGTGLGLALSRRLVEAMGGTMEVASKPGEGSTFSIELVRSEPAAIEVLPGEVLAPTSVRAYEDHRTVLYVEDTVANLRLVEEILARRPGVQVLPAMMGRLGIELAREHRPDLILLDLHLPDIDGARVLDELRSSPETREIPVVVLTADATNRQLDRVLAAGASAYLTKPIGVLQLLDVVDRFIPTTAGEPTPAS